MHEGRPVTLLLVEDDDGDAKAVIRAFAREGIVNCVLRAVDGVEALHMLRTDDPSDRLDPPYIILLDLNMPRMGGLQFLTALRSDPALRWTVVFVLSTSRLQEDVEAARALNVAGFIPKGRSEGGFDRLVSLLERYWRVIEFAQPAA